MLQNSASREPGAKRYGKKIASAGQHLEGAKFLSRSRVRVTLTEGHSRQDRARKNTAVTSHPGQKMSISGRARQYIFKDMEGTMD